MSKPTKKEQFIFIYSIGGRYLWCAENNFFYRVIYGGENIFGEVFCPGCNPEKAPRMIRYNIPRR